VKFVMFVKILICIGALTASGVIAAPTGGDSEPMPGGVSPNAKDGDRKAEFEELAYFALDDSNKKCNCMYRQGLVRIKDVKTQVVAGEMVYITIYTGKTTCKKNGDQQALKSCPLMSGSEGDNGFEVCDVEIWVKKWENFQEVRKMDCKKSTRQEAEA